MNKKQILAYLNANNNLENFKTEEIKKLELKEIAISYGIYGMNAGLFQSRTNGHYYVVPSRSSILFMLA